MIARRLLAWFRARQADDPTFVLTLLFVMAGAGVLVSVVAGVAWVWIHAPGLVIVIGAATLLVFAMEALRWLFGWGA